MRISYWSSDVCSSDLGLTTGLVLAMGNENLDFLPDDPQPGPSWANSRWPLVGGEGEDDLTRALDPTAMKLAVREAAAKAGKPTDPIGRSSCRDRGCRSV